MKFLALLIAASFLAGCTSLQSVSTTSVPAQRSRKLVASSDRMIILGLNFNNDYVDSLIQDLARQCPNGKVEGILTKQEVVDYFIMIVYKSRVSATGYCVGSTVASQGKGRVPGSEGESGSEAAE